MGQTSRILVVQAKRHTFLRVIESYYSYREECIRIELVVLHSVALAVWLIRATVVVHLAVRLMRPLAAPTLDRVQKAAQRDSGA